MKCANDTLNSPSNGLRVPYTSGIILSMIDQLGDRLPSWTPAEIALVQGSNDFLALNYYISTFIKHRFSAPTADDYLGITEMVQQNLQGQWIGPETDTGWLFARVAKVLELD